MKFTQELGTEIVEASLVEFQIFLGMWRDLERKAQVTIATAGIFLASIFAFIRTLVNSSFFEKLLLFSTITLLLMTVFKAAKVLKTKEIKRIPLSQDMTKWAHELRSLEDPKERPEKTWCYYTQRASQWQVASKHLEDKYNEKYQDLNSAHCLLSGALFAVCLIAVFKIF